MQLDRNEPWELFGPSGKRDPASPMRHLLSHQGGSWSHHSEAPLQELLHQTRPKLCFNKAHSFLISFSLRNEEQEVSRVFRLRIGDTLCFLSSPQLQLAPNSRSNGSCSSFRTPRPKALLCYSPDV